MKIKKEKKNFSLPSHQEHHPAWIEVNLEQLKRNLEALKQKIHHQNQQYLLPVKANAYGHGIIPMGLFAEKCGVDYLGVSCLQEGILLRKAGVKIPILVFGAFSIDQIPELIQNHLEITLSSRDKTMALLRYCQENSLSALVHLEMETGMQRTGMRPETLSALYTEICSTPNIEQWLKVKGIYSHLATADEPQLLESTYNQAKVFFQSVQNLNLSADIKVHLCNSAGLINLKQEYQFHLVRPGILSYGLFEPHLQKKFFPELAPVLSLKARITFFKVVEAGKGISYGHTYRATKRTRLVTIPIGYGDGYHRLLSNRAEVLIRGKRYPVRGNICMDQLMVEIGDDEAHVGDIVTLLGRNGNEEITAHELARHAETNSYEILCSLTERLPRIYL